MAGFDKKIKNNKTSDEQYLIISDIDGTLLNSNKEIDQETIKGIKKIVKAGHIFCLASGRLVCDIKPIYDKLGLDTVICAQNGAIITNPSDPKFPVINITFKKELLYKLLQNKKLDSYVENFLISGVGKGWIWKGEKDDEMDKMIEALNLLKDNVKRVNRDLKKIDTDIVNMQMYIKQTEKLDDIIYEIKKEIPTADCVKWIFDGGFCLEIGSQHASKRTALEYLSSYYGIPLENTIAFGDSHNDTGMLKKAAWGFAMKNGKEIVKIAARTVTKYSNDESGVAREICNLLNIK